MKSRDKSRFDILPLEIASEGSGRLTVEEYISNSLCYKVWFIDIGWKFFCSFEIVFTYLHCNETTKSILVVAYKRFTGFVMSLLYCNNIFKAPTSRGLLFAPIPDVCAKAMASARRGAATIINH